MSTIEPKQKSYPVTTGADVAKDSESKGVSRYCLEDSMDPGKVKGKLVYCILGTWGADSVVKGLGGIGTIIESEQYLDSAAIFMAPATLVNSTTGKRITDYIHSTRYLYSVPALFYLVSREQEMMIEVNAGHLLQ